MTKSHRLLLGSSVFALASITLLIVLDFGGNQSHPDVLPLVGEQTQASTQSVSMVESSNQSIYQASQKEQSILVQAQAGLGERLNKVTAQSDFGMMPHAITSSLLKRRCSLLRRTVEEMSGVQAELPAQLHGADQYRVCEYLLYALLKERFELSVSEASFWASLQQVDFEFQARARMEGATQDAVSFARTYQEFIPVRQGLLGADLDADLFSVADARALMPLTIEQLNTDISLSENDRIKVYREAITDIKSMLEPMELARMEMSLMDAPDFEQQLTVIAYYAGDEYAADYADRVAAEQDRQQRLFAYQEERAQQLEQFAQLDEAQRTLKLQQLDDELINKYELN